MGTGEFHEQGVVCQRSVQIRDNATLSTLGKNGPGKGILTGLDDQFTFDVFASHRIVVSYLHAIFWKPETANLSDDVLREAV
ncbi:hypothetical protein [Thioalkalivibrio sp. ALJ4]|uniref:hypothetical protein n=1 Tax=Thioalkalivibrio sp. ALJ4 TaxID=1240558 RepID=UPI00036FC456|nr:hypothetical protein [Thioalkalivibrio sp. ALJ4]